MTPNCMILSMLNWFSIFEAKYLSISISSAASNPIEVNICAYIDTYRTNSVGGFSLFLFSLLKFKEGRGQGQNRE